MDTRYDNVKPVTKDYYSQNDEERFIVEFFKDFKGRFLDVGAFDGVNLSNTRKLLELGWTGVLVEPEAHNFLECIKNSKGYEDKVVLVQVAVSGVPGLKKFWVDTTQDREWSTTINEELFKSGSVLAPIKIDMRVPACLIGDLEPFGPYDFISIDAEWEDLAILNTMPESMLRSAKLFCIECRAGERDVMKKALSDRGMEVVYETNENLLCVNKPA